MPIGLSNWNPVTKTYAIEGCGTKRGTGQFTFRKDISGNDVLFDDSAIFDKSINPWGIVHQNDIIIGKLTGNNAAKLAKFEQWFQRYLLDQITLRADLPELEPTKTVDPDRPSFFWCDEDGTKNLVGLYICARSVQLVKLIIADFANGNVTAHLRIATP